MGTAREQSAERIEHVAIELFAQHGFEAVGVRDIARQANVPVSAINYYFGSKEALYRECARKLTQEYLDEARVRLRDGAGLAEVLGHFLDFGVRKGRLIRMWLDLQLSGDPDSMAYSNREMVDPVWRVFREAMEGEGEASLERRLGALSFVGAVILGSILTDEQIESLTEAPADMARGRWREEILGQLVAPAFVQRMRAAK